MVLVVLTGMTPVLTVAAAESSPLQVTVDLTDGSRLIGITKLTSLPVRSEALGKLQIPLAKIRAVKFSRDHESVNVTMTNGDQMKGGLDDLSLELRTCFGEVTIPVEHVTAISISVPSTDQEHFSAAGDFSAEANPKGSWSYGWCAKTGEEFHLYTEKLPNGPIPEIEGWGTPVTGPCVAFCTGKEELHPDNSITIRPGQLCFHPGPSGERSVIRWTAPRSGRFQITGAFTGLSGYNGSPPTTTDVHVFHNDQSVFDSFINLQEHGNEAPFDLQQEVKAGDTVNFVLGYGNGSHVCDTTGLDAAITLHPSAKEKHP